VSLVKCIASNNERANMSHIFASFGKSNVSDHAPIPSTITTLPAIQALSKPASTNIDCDMSIEVGVAANKTCNKSLTYSFFAGANFNGPVTINVQINQ
jgi:hypothetical protein